MHLVILLDGFLLLYTSWGLRSAFTLFMIFVDYFKKKKILDGFMLVAKQLQMGAFGMCPFMSEDVR